MNAALDLGAIVRERSAGYQRPFVVAIDGRSGSGKSTLATELATVVPAVILDGDAFFAGGVSVRDDEPRTRAAECIDWQRQRVVLEALRAGSSATYRPFDWDAFDGTLSTRSVTIAPSGVVIVEGVYSARPELADLVDLRVLLEVPDAVRIGRLRSREGEIGPWEEQWHEAEDWYFAALPAGWFDLVTAG